MEAKKIISLEVKNKQLDALEDLLTAELSAEDRKKAVKKVMALWKAMVNAYDNADNTINDLPQANKIIEEQKVRIKQLEDEEIAFPFRLYLALEAILDHDPIYQLVPPKEINVFDIQFELYRKIKLLPKDIICILSEEDGRKKTIYAYEENLEGERELNKYTFNKAGGMETWARFFDKLAHRLIKVSKSAIANVAYYEIANDNYLHLNPKMQAIESVQKIRISEKKSIYNTFKNDFIKIKEVYRNHILSQKKILAYMILVENYADDIFAL